MDFDQICQKLDSSEVSLIYIESVSKQAAELISKSQLEVVNLVRGLEKTLHSTDYKIRSKGVELLSKTVTSLPNDLLNTKEIEVINEFVTLRLIDHKSMEQSSLKCLSYFVQCKNKPSNYNMALIEFLKTKPTIRRMDAKNRRLIYDIAKRIVDDKQAQSRQIEGELIYSLVSLMDGENNPENLLICFGTMSTILKKFDDIEPYIDDIFEWLASYYPLDYTPSEDSDSDLAIQIQRSDLIGALYDCFYANPLNADCLLGLILEKLDSNTMSTKMESLNCLIKCIEVFPLDSVKKYNSTIWTAIRSNCLRKIETLDNRFFDLSLKALNVLAQKLSSDRELHFTFITDMYEELAIAFRKPEMDLFEPAARLMAHVISPTIAGFDYVIEKILTVSINAVTADELRPLSGLAYIFELLASSSFKLDSNLTPKIENLSLLSIEHIEKEDSAIRFVNAVIDCHIDLGSEAVQKIVSSLIASIKQGPSSAKELCLASICLNYERLHDIGLEPKSYQLVDLFEALPGNDVKLSDLTAVIYYRLLIYLTDSCKQAELNGIGSQRLNVFLSRLRLSNSNSNQVGLLHAILLNKLDEANAQPILMNFFQSDYCQKLISSDQATVTTYLPVVGWVLKSLVIRNHPMFSPLINLLLNYITSDQVDTISALEGVKIFNFTLTENGMSWSDKKDYRKFVLYKQKFYMQAGKEIKIRYEKESTNYHKRQLLLCALVFQINHIPMAVYRKDIDWLFRELIRVLTSRSENDNINEELVCAIYECMGNLILGDISEQIHSFLPSLIDINLKHAQGAPALRIRQAALRCLANISRSFKHSDLLIHRSSVIDKLHACLSDKKRLVRQSAADARLKWTLIGQPISS